MNDHLKQKSCVYCATNKINGKKYIGYTETQLNRRISSHYSKAKWKNKSKTYFHKALMKYKKSDFEWNVLFVSENLNELKLKETYFIYRYKTNQKKYGYNLTTGGEELHFNDSVKRKISERAKERNLTGINNPFFGKTHTDETKKHFSEIRKGKESPRKGCKLSKKTKKLLSLRRIEMCKDSEFIESMKKIQKSIKILHLISGVAYDSIAECSRKTLIPKSTIKLHLKKNINFKKI